MTILITGSKGQLGSEIQRLSENLDKDEFHFIFTDKEELDITDRQAVYDFVEQNKVVYGLAIGNVKFLLIGVDKLEFFLVHVLRQSLDFTSKLTF